MRYKIHIHWHRAVAIICVLSILLAIQPIQAQENGRSLPLLSNHPFTHLTTDDGLTHNNITAILQDQYGFMWIGTEDGLNLYDGYQIRTFKHEVGVEGSLSSSTINALLEDDTGQIWVATETGGVSIFDRLTETFTQFNPTDDDHLNTADIRALTKGSDGKIWLGFGRGALAQYDPQTETYTEYPASFAGRLDKIVIDDQGFVWLAGASVFRFDPETAVVTPYRPLPGNEPANRPTDGPPGGGPPPDSPEGGEPGRPPARGGGPIVDLLLDANDTLWVATGPSIFKFDPQTETFKSFSTAEVAETQTPVNRFYTDSQGFIWVGSGSGLSLFDSQSESYVNHFIEDPVRPDSLSSNEVQVIYEDQGGVIWIGTGAGINLLNRQQAHFNRYQFHPLNENSLATPSVGAVIVDEDGIVWAETELFLNRLDRVTGEITRYSDEADPFARGAPPDLQYWLGIHDDGQGALWLARWEGIYRFDKVTGTFEHFAPENHLTPSQTRDGINSMSTTADGAIWLTTGPLVYRFDPDRITFEIMWQAQEVPDIANGIMATGVYVAPAGDAWVMFGRNGIGRLSPETRQVTRYMHHPDEPNSLLPGEVHTIYQMQDELWLGTTNGLTRLDLSTETFTHFSEDAGLPNTAVVAILPDDDGHLWLSTHKGLVQFDPQAGRAVRSYGVADGLPSNEFNDSAAFHTADGEMFFGSTNGLLVFNPTQIQDNPYQPPVVLTKMNVWHESKLVEFNQISDKPIYLTEEIVLGPEDEFFQLEFAVLSYASPEKNLFEYRLDGFDEQWWTNEDTGRPSVNYNHIDPGSYTFRARGTNNDGVWSEHEVVLTIIAQPHWYATWWARTIFVIMGIGAVVGFFASRMRSAQKRAALLEAQVTERTQELSEQAEQLEVARDNAEAANRAKSTFLSNMSHELRSPLNAILGFSQVMQRSNDLSSENRENLNIISRSGEHLLTLINQVLDLSKIEAGQATLNESDFDLHQLLADVENMFRLKAEEQNLQLLFEGTVDVPQYVRTDEVKLRQVLINLLNNALKFTDEGGISVRVGKREAEGSNTQLIFEVEDTGAGIAEDEMEKLFEAFAQTETGRKSQEGTGLGLPISRRFVQLMGGDMTVSSQVGLGTVFHFEVVVQEAQTADPLTSSSSRRVIALQPDQKRYRILIVDDIVTNRQLLVRLLGPLGFDLREAGNGQEAIEIWEEFKPHLIWMDMRMPVLNGYEATQHIKETTQGQATAVIALTASSFEGERHVILSAGCDDYLRKPFRESEIFEMMHKHLGVEYVYEAETEMGDGRSTETPLKTADLIPISANLLAQLTQAIESIDLTRMDTILDEIQQEQPQTAEKLNRLVKQFEYDTILTTIEAALEEK